MLMTLVEINKMLEDYPGLSLGSVFPFHLEAFNNMLKTVENADALLKKILQTIQNRVPEGQTVKIQILQYLSQGCEELDLQLQFSGEKEAQSFIYNVREGTITEAEKVANVMAEVPDSEVRSGLNILHPDDTGVARLKMKGFLKRVQL
jgi:hypothetical protein